MSNYGLITCNESYRHELSSRISAFLSNNTNALEDIANYIPGYKTELWFIILQGLMAARRITISGYKREDQGFDVLFGYPEAIHSWCDEDEFQITTVWVYKINTNSTTLITDIQAVLYEFSNGKYS